MTTLGPNKTNVTKLFHAVIDGKRKEVKPLLALGTPIDSLDALGRTPLCIAVLKNNYPMVEMLLKLGANVHAAGKDAKSALFCSQYTEEEIQKLFKEALSSIKKLFYAVHKNNASKLEALIHSGTNINAAWIDEDSKVFFVNETPLHVAVRSGHLECIDLLLKYWADLDAKDDQGFTPLDLAEDEDYGQPDIAERLRQVSVLDKVDPPKGLFFNFLLERYNADHKTKRKSVRRLPESQVSTPELSASSEFLSQSPPLSPYR